MSKVIRIDDDVFKALQAKASEINEPFYSCNRIIRIALGIEAHQVSKRPGKMYYCRSCNRPRLKTSKIGLKHLIR